MYVKYRVQKVKIASPSVLKQNICQALLGPSLRAASFGVQDVVLHHEQDVEENAENTET